MQPPAPAPINPGLIALAEIIKDGYLKNQEKDVKARAGSFFASFLNVASTSGSGTTGYVILKLPG